MKIIEYPMIKKFTIIIILILSLFEFSCKSNPNNQFIKLFTNLKQSDSRSLYEKLKKYNFDVKLISSKNIFIKPSEKKHIIMFLAIEKSIPEYLSSNDIHDEFTCTDNYEYSINRVIRLQYIIKEYLAVLSFPYFFLHRVKLFSFSQIVLG